MQTTITRAPTMTAAAGRGRRTTTMVGIGKAAIALALVGGLLWLAATGERAEAPPTAAAPGLQSDGRADSPPSRPAAERVREWEDWHGNWFVSPRGGVAGGPAR